MSKSVDTDVQLAAHLRHVAPIAECVECRRRHQWCVTVGFVPKPIVRCSDCAAHHELVCETNTAECRLCWKEIPDGTWRTNNA